MFTLAEETSFQTMTEKAPGKGETLLILTRQSLEAEVRNTVAGAFKEGAHFRDGAWEIPGGGKIIIRKFNDIPLNGKGFRVWVCNGGLTVSASEQSAIEAWRKSCES